MKKGYSVPPCPDCGKLMRKGSSQNKSVTWFCMQKQCIVGSQNHNGAVSKLSGFASGFRSLIRAR